MTQHYAHLGVYSDWVRIAAGPHARSSRPTTEKVRHLVHDVLAVPQPDEDIGGSEEQPTDVRVERRWTADGLAGEELTYSVGYGPRTRAWLLKPTDAAAATPKATSPSPTSPSSTASAAPPSTASSTHSLTCANALNVQSWPFSPLTPSWPTHSTGRAQAAHRMQPTRDQKRLQLGAHDRPCGREEPVTQFEQLRDQDLARHRDNCAGLRLGHLVRRVVRSLGHHPPPRPMLTPPRAPGCGQNSPTSAPADAPVRSRLTNIRGHN